MSIFRDQFDRTAYLVDDIAQMLGTTRHGLDWYVRHGYLKAYGTRQRRRISAESLHWWRWWQETNWPSDARLEGYIYLVLSYHMYKIGFSIDVPKRVRAMQATSATPITLLHTIPTNDMQRAEQFLHNLYAPKRKHGEWFKLNSQRHVAIIQNCKGMHYR